MSNKNDRNHRKLRVNRETLRQLSGGDLAQVQGGAIPLTANRNNCTAKLSGCISNV